MRKNYICPSVNNEDLVSDCDLFDEILGLYTTVNSALMKILSTAAIAVPESGLMITPVQTAIRSASGAEME